jgi:hypothetical protein
LILKEIEQILLTPEWRKVIEEEMPKDSYKYHFLQEWFANNEEDKWIPDPGTKQHGLILRDYGTTLVDDNVFFLQCALEVVTYNRSPTPLSFAISNLLSLRSFSPKYISYLFHYQDLRLPCNQSDAPELNNFLYI